MTEIINRHHYFGACPHCGNTDGYLNYGRDHWFVCHAHKTRWLVGSNLFSSWQHETKEDWKDNAAVLKQYDEVHPLPITEDDAA